MTRAARHVARPTRQTTIPVLRPFLPTHDALIPYLSQIDHHRHYSNWGPLVLELEKRLSARVGGHVRTFANGTIALTLALQAVTSVRDPAQQMCLMPSWTFTATPAAALHAGLTPYFVDITRDQIMSLEHTQALLSSEVFRGKTAAMILVLPFGMPIDLDPWERLSAQTGVPLVVDAAAGFDQIRATSALTMVSLHATKVMGIGEGAFLVSTCAASIERARALSGYGFEWGSRISQLPGTNAKMNEFSAAVGLAALDQYAHTRHAWMQRAAWYAAALPGWVRMQPGFGQTWIGSTLHVCFDEAVWQTSHMMQHLADHNIESRAWWGQGCHQHPAYAALPRMTLFETERAAQKTIGLPFSLDMSQEAVHTVVEALSTLQQPIRSI